MKRHKRLIVHRQAVVNNLTTGKPLIKGNVLKRELPVVNQTPVNPPVVPTPP